MTTALGGTDGFLFLGFSLLLTVSTAQQPLGPSVALFLPSAQVGLQARWRTRLGRHCRRVPAPCPEAEELELMGMNSGNALPVPEPWLCVSQQGCYQTCPLFLLWWEPLKAQHGS